MNIVLLQGQMTLQEIDQLLKEFPQYLFLSLSESAYKGLSKEHWSRLEILYGARLTKEDLREAHHLRWIHCPGPHLYRLCMDDIEKQGNILVSNTLDENIPQMGEYVMAGILTFAKNLFEWKELKQKPASLWNSKSRDTMWHLKNKTLLQIGMGKVGLEIAKRAHTFGLKVYGMDHQKSYHPYCQKTFSFEDLSLILPESDVVCLSLARGKEYKHWFQEEQLKLMKEDSILIVIGSSDIVDEEALAKIAKTGKFRGILLDANYQTPLSPSSILWEIPEILITPEVAPRPKSIERRSFRIFLYNLRQYTYGNFQDMRNVVEKTASSLR
jgi:D-2-hydroxyacid dehydrogenase (NADP+)